MNFLKIKLAKGFQSSLTRTSKTLLFDLKRIYGDINCTHGSKRQNIVNKSISPRQLSGPAT